MFRLGMGTSAVAATLVLATTASARSSRKELIQSSGGLAGAKPVGPANPRRGTAVRRGFFAPFPESS